MGGEERAGGPSGPPVCPHCGRPQDDFATMDQEQALEAIHLGLLRDLARKVNSGDATGIELNVARGLLKDNRKKVEPPPEKPEEDDALPEQAPKRQFPIYGHDE